MLIGGIFHMSAVEGGGFSLGFFTVLAPASQPRSARSHAAVRRSATYT
jgi:hypothetical protein